MAVQYWRYLRGLAHGDLGESHTTGRPVLEDLLQRVPATLELTLAALAVALAVGIPLGVVAAVRRDGWLDHVSRLVGVGGVAMPTFWTGLLALYVFFYALGVAPPPLGRLATGITPPPRVTGLLTIDAVLTMDGRALAPLTRMVRATMLEVLESDYIKAAWAAGLPRRTVVYGDALRNCMIPVITLLGVVFGFLMAGNVVVESVFAWPGIGNYAVSAMMSKDSGPIQSFVLFVGVVYVFVNLAVDLVYGIVDPRIRLR
jgi:peptide/nickel transport system permease protein